MSRRALLTAALGFGVGAVVDGMAHLGLVGPSGIPCQQRS